MIRKIKVTDYPRLMEIWESAVVRMIFLKRKILYITRDNFRYISSMSIYSDLNKKEP